MFFAPSTFAFTERLTAHWPTVLAECAALPSSEFAAWPETRLYNQGWDVYGLYVMEKPLLGNCLFCPHTAALVKEIPGLRTAGFSRLAPGTEIRPHVGYSHDVLRLHLTLRSHGDCGLRVGGEVRRWTPGHCLIFDDTVEHEAWNRSTAERIVLLVDFTKPRGLTADADGHR
ncbi:aspartyl/asparaginyl beta-hydroxylase domain-containing protein [Trinickia fusca]|uniref:Aspartyl/asparaginyl beta-hydroxylase domain-containing protein n=1 Tax=Trinickia fusca TaxID=2419777 RepID=A0A494X9J2_9BURK|nr:aspartyl/asparaginyl beta-hydroxylase domain-containing protein [Trinickia fusca]RKP46822.1 aspartyl/asparaginyl beta-hydroxylase domain-containing protein [Trinickia fusca]